MVEDDEVVEDDEAVEDDGITTLVEMVEEPEMKFVIGKNENIKDDSYN